MFRLAVASSRDNDRRRPALPLRLALIALFVLLTVGTVGFVETLFFLNGQQAAQNLANRLMDDVGGRVGLYLETYLQTPQLVNRLNADAVALGELDLQDLPALERHLFTQLMQFESLSGIQAGNRQNDFRMVTRQDGLRLLQSDSANPTQMQEYALNGGGVKSDLMSASSATTVRNQLWYQTALFLEKPTWGVISQSSTGDVSLTATRPVFDAQGQVSGVFSAAIFLNAINTFLSQLQLAKYGKVFILEPNGWIVSTSDQKWSESGSPFQRFNLVDSPDPVAQMAGRSLIQQFGDFSRIDRPQQLVFSQQGDRHFLQVMPFRDEYGLNWLTVVTVPEAEFLGQIHLSTRTTLLICAIALLVSILLGLWMARCISRPIQQLSRASYTLAEGEWREPFSSESPFAEVQVLATAFNRMARQLQDYFDHAATALKASEEKFAKMFHSTPDPIVIATQEGHYLEVNDAFVEVFGYSRAEVIGRKVSEVELWVCPEERKHYVRSIEALGRIKNQEYMFRKKTGAVLTALFSTETVNIGEQKCFIGIAKEITDRKRMEENLRQSEAALREAQRIAHIGSWEYDPQTQTLTGSEELFRICGLTPKPFFSLDEFSQVIHSGDRCTHQQLIDAAVVEGRIYRNDARILHRDGSVRHVEVRGEPVFDAEGNLIRIMGTALDITDRKQIEDALRQSEQLFRNAFVSSAFGISIRSMTGRYLQVNPALCKMLGYTEAELLNLTYRDLTHPNDLAIDPNNTIRKLVTGEIDCYELEKRFLHKEGQIIWGLISMSIVRDLEQHPLYFVTQVQDISDRKRAEAALRQSETRLRNLAAAAPVNIYSLVQRQDGSIEFEYINQVVEEFHEVSLEEFLADPAQIIMGQMHPDYREGYRAAAERSAETLERFNYEWQIITPSGKVKWLQAHSQPERRENGDVCWHGVVLDVSDRKQSEEALRQSEARFQKLAATSPGEIFIKTMHTDGSLTFEYISSVCQEIHELEPEAFLENSAPFFEQMHPDDLPLCLEAATRCAQDLTPLDHELRIITPSGKVKWMRLTSRPERQDNGDISWYGIMLDITDRKQIEERLQQSEATKEQILKAIPDLIIWMASDGTCLDLIDGSMGTDLYVRSESVGKNLYDLFPSDMAQARAIAIQQALQTSEVQLYEQQLTVRGSLQYEEVRVVSVGGDRFLVIVRNITQRKLSEIQRQRAEAELEIQRSFFRQVIDVMPSSVFVKDLEGRFLLANQVVSESYGFPVEEIIGRREADFNLSATPEQLEHCSENNWEVITSGQPKQTLPYQIVKANGEQRWVQTLLRPLVGTQGQSQGIVGNTIDVTDLKQAEADLRRQIRRSQLFSDIALKIRQSLQFEEILQTTVTEVQTFLQVDRVMIFQFQGNGSGKVVQEAIVPGNITTLYQVFADLCFPEAFVDRYRQGRIRAVADIETLNIDPCHLNFLRSLGVRAKLIIPIFVGSHLWGLLIAHHGLPRTWSDFEIDLLQELANQAGIVLAQSQLLAAQKESEERFRSAFDAAPIGIALVGLDERWIKINPVLCTMLGYPESSLLGRDASTLIHPDDTQKFRRCVEQCVEQCAKQTLTDDNYTAQAELRYCCSGGRIAWALLSLSTVRGAQNQPLYYVSQIQDITERHALDQMKTEFISIISHELRTPLTAMRGSLGLIATGVYDRKPEKAKRMIEIAVNNSDRLVRLVNDILDLERLSSDKVQLMQERCCVAELLQRASEGLQAIADDASVAIVIEMAANNPSQVQVWGEPDAIIQTLTNLISNAIKFSPPHTIVRLSAYPQIDSVLFQVKDQGRGIPLDKLEAIFERFQQVDVSDSRQKGGTGLGLAICRKIVQRHGGEIWVESTVGEGSSFYFTLPIPPGEQP
ncbi:MAG: PAS domain S-box protein [Drouetiella hepatica Uher 2000/2452]|jgi:PAS domain S-box-containing protein|uniref:histidine kinase n=1 Tax=Drouetiella hepatica Uher 2000/2452 TaxID=904376 RepID=A0A951QD21_9CYAN|nr:PAS domain S-box protein [Drouetiella hepatica Uher 2000/2452]